MEKGKTMTDYIKREDAINIINHWWGDSIAQWLVKKIKNVPSEDVAPVRHGCWQITDAYPHNVYCSECHTKCAQTHWAVWEDGSLPRRYCPNCGARMDGDGNEID